MSYRVIDVLQDYIDRETGQRSVMAELAADTAADLPTNTQDLVFIIGSFATAIDTGDTYKISSAGAWILQPSANQFENVYTKSEVDSIVSDINDDIDTLETDINGLHTAVSEIIDSGAKNLCDMSTGNGTRFVNIPIVLQPGQYRVYFGTISTTDTDATTCQCGAFASDNSAASNLVQLQRIDETSGILTVTQTTGYVRLYASSSYAGGAGDTVTFADCMICTENNWKISPKYVPYCPTLAELYAIVKSYHP